LPQPKSAQGKPHVDHNRCTNIWGHNPDIKSNHLHWDTFAEPTRSSPKPRRQQVHHMKQLPTMGSRPLPPLPNIINSKSLPRRPPSRRQEKHAPILEWALLDDASKKVAM
jgi:hypothetical protein